MLPLLFLELRLTSCPDPEAMLARFGTKVLLLHGCFMILRVCAWPIMEVGIGWSNLAGVLAVLLVLHVGFRFKWRFETFQVAGLRCKRIYNLMYIYYHLII